MAFNVLAPSRRGTGTYTSSDAQVTQTVLNTGTQAFLTATMNRNDREDPTTRFDFGYEVQNPNTQQWVEAVRNPFVGGTINSKTGLPNGNPVITVNIESLLNWRVRAFISIPAGVSVSVGLDLDWNNLAG